MTGNPQILARPSQRNKEKNAEFRKTRPMSESPRNLFRDLARSCSSVKDYMEKSEQLCIELGSKRSSGGMQCSPLKAREFQLLSVFREQLTESDVIESMHRFSQIPDLPKAAWESMGNLIQDISKSEGFQIAIRSHADIWKPDAMRKPSHPPKTTEVIHQRNAGEGKQNRIKESPNAAPVQSNRQDSSKPLAPEPAYPTIKARTVNLVPEATVSSSIHVNSHETPVLKSKKPQIASAEPSKKEPPTHMPKTVESSGRKNTKNPRGKQYVIGEYTYEDIIATPWLRKLYGHLIGLPYHEDGKDQRQPNRQKKREEGRKIKPKNPKRGDKEKRKDLKIKSLSKKIKEKNKEVRKIEKQIKEIKKQIIGLKRKKDLEKNKAEKERIQKHIEMVKLKSSILERKLKNIEKKLERLEVRHLRIAVQSKLDRTMVKVKDILLRLKKGEGIQPASLNRLSKRELSGLKRLLLDKKILQWLLLGNKSKKSRAGFMNRIRRLLSHIQKLIRP